MTHLANLTATDWLIIAGASWTIAAFFVAPPIGRFLRGRADITRRAQYPPPVPTPRPREDDASWVEVWPTADEAEQAVYDRLFDRLIDIEGLR